MPTILDVAKRARVSTATVSAVLNDSAYVSPVLRERVTDAVQALNYQPNLVARSLARQRTQTIGMIALNIANPFWPAVVRGVEDAARSRKYELLLANSDDNPEKEAQYLRLFLAQRVDGILLTKSRGRIPEDIAERLKALGVPVVQLMRFGTGLHSDVVTVDEEGGSFEAVAHLVRLGYRRIGMLNGPNVSTSRRRFVGYKEALEAGGLEVDPDLVVSGDFRVESGYDAGITLLKRRPEAVFVANYLSAVGFMSALRQYQLRCPEDVGLVTCDDHPWVDAFSPRLTTINLPKYEVGQAGADLLLDILNPADGHRRPKRFKTITLKTSLRIRESCGYALRVGPMGRRVETDPPRNG